MTRTLAGEVLRAAGDSPTRVFLRMRGTDLTYAEVAALVEHRARRLASLGVRRGEAVALLMDNHVEQIVTWFALNRLGVLHAPLNPALTGDRLAHALATAGAVLVIADDSYARGARAHGVRVMRTAELAALPDGPEVVASGRDDLATATLLFTSGTTGPSKACALSNRYLIRQAELHVAHLGLTADDVLYTPFPLFHIDAATLTVGAALTARATAAVGRRFSASGFWDEVRDTGATVFNFMGATLSILWKRDPSPADRTHRVRLAWGVPMPGWQHGFTDRFGIALRQVYGLTDAGVPVYDPAGDGQRPGRAGRVIAEFEVRIDTARRRPGDPEGVGEILIRGREPGLVMNGYHGDPAATARTVVDGWVRTGDLGDLDPDGFLAFHGRLSDSIRRRGENISAYEVEELVTAHPEVIVAAAVGVPSELTEEDVLVWVVRRPGSVLSAPDLRAWCLARGPAFMVPRYIRFTGELPRTPTEKVEKFRIRDAGPAGAWDGEAAR